MANRKQGKKTIAFVVYPGCTLLELVGAFHILFGATMMTQYQVVAVGEHLAEMEYAEELQKLGGCYVHQSWIEDGNLITAAGVSGAIDMALHLAAKLTSEAKAKQVQLVIEYDPAPPFGGIDWGSANGHGNGSGGMPLPGTQPAEEKTIALVIYQGLTVFDLAGPLQVYSTLARLDPRFRVEVVAERMAPIKTDLGIEMIPTRTFDEVPHPHVMVVPGGDQPTIKAMLDPAVRRYVRQAAGTAAIAGSVCTGALILAGAGLLADARRLSLLKPTPKASWKG